MPTKALPRADAVLALWGVTAGDETALAANTTLAEDAQRLGAALGARLVIHASSAAVYGADPRARFSEDAPLDRPVTPYGAAKRAMEARLQALAPQGPRAVWLRIANVAGADALFGNVARGTPITLDRFADGSGPLRSYIAPQDLARVVVALARSDDRPEGALNVAAPGAVAMQTLLEAAGIPFEWRDAPETALQRVVLDVTRQSRHVTLGPEAADPGYLVASARAVGAIP
jgi:nucleoside-diphosphate-sugar epimerase